MDIYSIKPEWVYSVEFSNFSNPLTYPFLRGLRSHFSLPAVDLSSHWNRAFLFPIDGNYTSTKNAVLVNTKAVVL
jgi:hypothetical protein